MYNVFGRARTWRQNSNPSMPGINQSLIDNSHWIAIERFLRFGSSARHHNFVARALESLLQDF